MRLNGIIQLSPYDMQRVDHALNYICIKYREHISAEHLSIEAGLSIKKLQAGLKKKTGVSLHGYHFRVRVEKSKLVLRNTDLPIKAIADSSGFKNKSHFCKVFKKHTGLTPTEYRFKDGD